MKRILFVCSENRLRSPTAETVFSEYEGIEAIGAGTNSDSDTPVSGDLIEWADVILVMEKSHKNKVSKKYLISKSLPLKYFPLKNKVFRQLLKTIKRVLRL